MSLSLKRRGLDVTNMMGNAVAGSDLALSGDPIYIEADNLSADELFARLAEARVTRR
jgi:hypothetical protein